MNELTAKEGMWLTQATLENEEKRGFWKRLYPAASLTPADFRDATEEEKAAWEAEHLPAEPAL